MTQNASFYINHLNLQPHPEGGYFKETYRATEGIPAASLPKGFNGDRSFSTAIYYLLRQGDYSAFHRIKSDECWHFYAGGTLHIHVIENDHYACIKLGSKIDAGETFQYVVPANAWFAAEPAENTIFSLAGCTVAPGFDFLDFEMADKHDLLAAYPRYDNIIARLCR
ncbi:MAG: cupin protein [Segetibacter sp.]|nr:cupin protein [Segetibacter sp.]